MRKLGEALERRDWSVHLAAKRCGLPKQVIYNLLGVSTATRDVHPGKVQAQTMVRLLEVFDELDLHDFVSGTELRVRRDGEA